MQRKVSVSLFLIFWYVMVGWAGVGDMGWPLTVVLFIITVPILLFALYLIWIDSKKPFEQQFRFANSRWGKK